MSLKFGKFKLVIFSNNSKGEIGTVEYDKIDTAEYLPSLSRENEHQHSITRERVVHVTLPWVEQDFQRYYRIMVHLKADKSS